MHKKDYEHFLIKQPRGAVASASHVIDTLNKQVYHLLTLKEIYDAQKVIIVGCGDSWLAGIAAKVVFESVAGIETEAMRCIDFSRHLNSSQLGFSPNTPLVIGVSVSGTVSRVAEALQRAQKHGANTIAITSNEESILAKSAKHVLHVGFPSIGEAGPGSNNYMTSMAGLTLLALRMARAKNTISQNVYEDMRSSVLAYIEETVQHLDEYEDKAFAVAQQWKDLRAYDFIGDYGDYATAFFGSAKVLESFGGITTYDDSEDWNHINYFLKNPETIGRVIVANQDCPSYSRLRESMYTIKGLNSPCIIVGDVEETDIPDGFTLFKSPKAKYPWLYPFVQHMPLGMVAGYISTLKGEGNAMMEVPVFYENPSVKDTTRIRNSKIEVL